MRNVAPSVTLLSITPNPAQLIERCGRICYKSEDLITDESANKFCEMILGRGHESVIEHASATFHIVCKRGLSHEIVRHRLASYSQESSRYCNYGKKKFGKSVSFAPPTGMTEEQQRIWDEGAKHTEDTYFALIDAGMKPQQARDALPIGLKTELAMTCNFREWRHFFMMRMHKAAHPELRPIAYAIWKILMEHCPPIFKEFEGLAREVEEECELLPNQPQSL